MELPTIDTTEEPNSRTLILPKVESQPLVHQPSATNLSLRVSEAFWFRDGLLHFSVCEHKQLLLSPPEGEVVQFNLSRCCSLSSPGESFPVTVSVVVAHLCVTACQEFTLRLFERADESDPPVDVRQAGA